MKKHFVTFYSPGSFVAETTEKPIESWDPDLAVAMARKITERHGATPYAFRFSTRERGDGDLDSHTSEKGPMYYLGGEVLTLADVVAQKDPKNDILIANMRGNHWDRVVVNSNSYRWTQPLEPGDVVLPFKPIKEGK